MAQVVFSVFTKPWRDLPASELATLVRRLGFDAVELPVRPGYQVPPEALDRLPEVARTLAAAGVRIASVAGPVSEEALAAYAAAAVPLVRVMYSVGAEGYLAAERRARAELERLVPLCARHGVRVGVQNHAGRYVAPHAFGLSRLLAGLDPSHVGAVWDAAHNALEGEDPEFALEALGDHLLMVNLKNAYRRRTTGPEAAAAGWRTWWTSGTQGLADWPRVARLLRQRAYDGTVCLTAEYSAEGEAARLAAADLEFARPLFA